MTRHTSFCFTVCPTAGQEKALWRHAGAARFAFNQLLELVKEAKEAKQAGFDIRIPWTGFDLINTFNRWKKSAEAGVHEDGSTGLAWRGEVVQQVFEEAAVDLGRGLMAFSSRREGDGKPAGFPRFKKRSASRQSFRIRNLVRRGGAHVSIRVGCAAGQERSIRLPKIGDVAVRESTRKLRQMLKKRRAKIRFATVSHRIGGAWKISLNIEAEPFHPSLRHRASRGSMPVGVDRGLNTFAVLANAVGREIERIDAPRPHGRALPKLRRLDRAVTRKKEGSRNGYRARLRLSKSHHRIGNIRRDFAHRLSSRLAKTHGHLVLETLSTKGLMRTHLARALADSAWAMFGSMLAYKVAWCDGTLTLANRFYPSTRRCSACGFVGDALPLWKRRFCCESCGHEADRDTNAAACLGQYPELSWCRVAAEQAETKNVCREGSAGAWGHPRRETHLGEAERASARRPRRAVSVYETAGTL